MRTLIAAFLFTLPLSGQVIGTPIGKECPTEAASLTAFGEPRLGRGFSVALYPAWQVSSPRYYIAVSLGRRTRNLFGCDVYLADPILWQRVYVDTNKTWYATWRIDLPNVRQLIGVTGYFQGFVFGSRRWHFSKGRSITIGK